MTSSCYTPQDIENEADRLNTKAGFTVPVDVEKVAKANGIALTISEDDLEEGVSGRIVIEDNKGHITLNLIDSP
jgi:hypothetical protein